MVPLMAAFKLSIFTVVFAVDGVPIELLFCNNFMSALSLARVAGPTTPVGLIRFEGFKMSAR